MKKIFLIILIFLVPVLASATDWYVRPIQGEYGAEDGASYNSAFDGLENVLWGPTGVQPGDTLYVCGTHVFEMYNPYSYFVTQGDVKIISGTGENARVTLRGDCPANDQGIIWGAYKNHYVNWTDEGDGIWSGMVFGNSPNDWYFQDIGYPDAGSYILLDPVASLEELRVRPGGAHYSAAYAAGDKIYVKLTDGSNPKDRFYFAEWGYDFELRNKHYITFKNLKFYVPGFRMGGYWDYSNMSHIIWDNCTLWYDVRMMFGNNVSHVEVRNCDIAWDIAGLGLTEHPAGNNMSPQHYVFSGNKIHDMGVRPSTYNSDAHGLGANGGRNGIIENNEFYNCGSGITYYAYPGQSIKNNTIRWNWFHDMHKLGGANSRGVEFNTGAGEADVSGNKIYGNIVGPGVDDVGYRYKYEPEGLFYNNVCYECGISFYIANHLHGIRAEIKNCISVNPKMSHININTASQEGEYHVDSDYNIFYPNTGNLFYFKDATRADSKNFSGWQALSCAGCTFDSHSIIANPLFVNPLLMDFHLQSDSPAIDAGANVGLTRDFEGNPVPNGAAPDMGAYEYQGSTSCAAADINCDTKIDILDLTLISMDFGKTFGFNAKCDINTDSIVDIFDVVYVASRFT